MFGFPPILDGNAGIKFTNNADSGFPKPGIREIFYSIKDGNWTDTTVWQTASGRVGLLPSANDDVYVRHTIGGSFVFTINNLIITPTGTLNGGNGGACTPLVINGSIFSYGVYNYGPNSNSLCGGALELRGTNNYIDKTKQTPTFIIYSGLTNQPIIDANYSALRVGGRADSAGEKYLTCDLTIGSFENGNVVTTQPCWFNLKNFNFTCNGNYQTVNGNVTLYAEGNQYILFKGTFSSSGGFFCSQAPTIEFQNNAAVGVGAAGNVNVARWNTPYGTASTASYLGTGIVKFTTNNQTFGTNFANLTLDNEFQIDDNITVTFNYPSTTSSLLSITKTINGLGANSRLVMGVNNQLNFATAASVPSMTTGTWDFTTNANTIQYNGNYSATIPSYFTTFSSLTIGGTGTKTLGVNTTLNGNLSVLNGASFECSIYDLTVTGTTTFATTPSGSTGTFSKSGAGNITFIGAVTMGSTNSTIVVSFAGNPNIEFRNGFSITTITQANFTSGTGTWSFTTNAQNILNGQGNTILTMNCNFSIVGITVTHLSGGIIIMNTGIINGTTSGSTFINNGNLYFANNTLPMATGVFTNSTTQGSIGYIMNTNFTIPLTSFFNLYISGAGTKTLSGNTTLNGTLTMNTLQGSGGSLECSTFNLTVTGTTTINTYQIGKNGAGNITFIGNVSTTNFTAQFTGNPNVEFRNGFSVTNFFGNTGTGTWSFTTNSQTFSANTGTYSCAILIGNGLTLTMSLGGFTGAFTGVINGSNATSTLLMGTGSPTLNYQNTTQPMATGILDTSTNLNTFIYGAGNQDVKGNPTAGQFQQYRNLRFSGSGTTKRLLGNINVQNTYTVDAGVTVNLNGFSKTP